MALPLLQALLPALAFALLPAASGLTVGAEPDSALFQFRETRAFDNKTWISTARGLELAMARSDLYRRFWARNKYLRCPPLNTTGTRIVHTLYFPYDKATQTFKDDEKDFDHGFYDELSTKLTGKYCIKLWYLSDMRKFVTTEYPGLWELVEKNADRPVAYVDFYRLLVVHEFGGIFWQYGSKPTAQMWQLEDPFGPFMPSEGKTAKLLIEKWMTQEQAEDMGKNRPSRFGKPSALKRIATQVFAAQPHNEFMRFACKRAIWNLLKIPVERDFDILETMGNGMFSEAFADYEKLGKAHTVDVIPFEETQHMVRYSHTFSWRRDKGRCC